MRGRPDAERPARAAAGSLTVARRERINSWPGAPELELTEATLVRAVRDHLKAEGWTCYLEVRDGYGGPRADVVATRGPCALVVEAKQRLTLQVLEQALRWRDQANMVAVAVWAAGLARDGSRVRRYSADFPQRLLRELGLGLLLFDHHGQVYVGHGCAGARWVRHKPRAPVLELLDPAQQDTEPGAAKGYHSDFRETCRRLVGWVRLNPGQQLRTALENVEHHYSSAKSARAALAHLLQLGKVPAIRMAEDGTLHATAGDATALDGSS